MEIQVFGAAIDRRPGLAILKLQGEINKSSETALGEAYTGAERDNPGTILLDFQDVSYINSTGIALIVGLLARARKEKRRLVVSGLSDHYRELFEITRLADFMTVYPDQEAALAEVG